MERVGVRGRFHKLRLAARPPHPARKRRADLSPHAGRGEGEGDMKIIRLACALAVAASMAQSAAQADDIVAMISQYRRAHGLPAVKSDAKLAAVAERQARAMAASGIMDHDVAGSFASRISGASADSAGENIAEGTKTWADTLRLWQNSPGHNANLLLRDADIIGIAVAHNDA